MITHFCRLVPPRPTFLQDMSAAEQSLMRQHAAHWRGWMDRGTAVVFGVVADPAGAFGIGIVEVENDAGLREVTEQDPVIRSQQGFRYEVLPMPLGAVHARVDHAA